MPPIVDAPPRRRTAARAVLGLVRACHAEPTATVTAVMTAFALSAGRGRGAVVVAAAVLTGQLSVGWSNDYVDRHRDVAAGRSDKPIPRGDVAAPVVGAGAVVAALACVPLSFASGWRAAVAHLAGVAAAWAYNLGLKSTVVSPLPYAVGFGLLPAFVVLGLPRHPAPPVWLVAAGALLGLGAHFVNVLPDLDDDARTGVRGLPHRIGARASQLTGAVLLLAATAVLAVVPARMRPLGVAGAVVAAAVVAAGLSAGRRAGSRAAFRATLLVAVLDVALLIARGATFG